MTARVEIRLRITASRFTDAVEELRAFVAHIKPHHGRSSSSNTRNDARLVCEMRIDQGRFTIQMELGHDPIPKIPQATQDDVAALRRAIDIEGGS